jgi:hypothetical protein
MTKFCEGQDVEVCMPPRDTLTTRWWRKARIIGVAGFQGERLSPNDRHESRDRYHVQFPEPNGKYDVDGERAVFDAEHIRAYSIYERWLSDNDRNDSPESRADWDGMIKANEEYMNS